MKFRFLFFILVLWSTYSSPADFDRKLLADSGQQEFNVTYNYVNPCCSCLSPMETFKFELICQGKIKFSELKSLIYLRIKSEQYKCHDINNLEYHICFNKDHSSITVKSDDKSSDNIYFPISEVKITVTSWD